MSADDDDGSRRMLWLSSAALVIVTAIVFWPLSSSDFINYDDPLYVTENSMVQRGLTWSGITWAFTDIAAFNWHPVTWLSHMLDVQLFGLKPRAHHLGNLAIHAANSVVLLMLLWQMTSAVWRSALVAALFAWHPLHVESVAWVAERKDMLSTLFGLLAIMAYVRWGRRGAVDPSKGRTPIVGYAWIVLWFALSLMAKPMFVTLPCVLLLLDFWPLNRWRRGGVPRTTLLLEKLPLLAMSIASSAITVYAQRAGGAIMGLERLPLTERLINAVVAYAAYLGKMIRPVELAVLYPHPGVWPWATVLLSAVVLVMVTMVVVVCRRRQPALMVGWLWYLGTLVPVIGVVQVGLQSMADRYTYVPLIGVFIMVVWGVSEVMLRRSQSVRRAAIVAACTILIALAVVTFWQARYWRNSETLFRRTLEVTSANYVIRNNLGVHYRRTNRLELALAEQLESVRINDRYAVAHDNLGVTLIDLKRPTEALLHLQRAVGLTPQASRPHNNLSSALADLGRWDEAITAMNQAIALEPNIAAYHLNLGNLLVRAGRFQSALEPLQRATTLEPANAAAWSSLGSAHWKMRQVQQAIEAFTTAVRLNPGISTSHVDLGVALAATGRLDEAIAQFQEAIRLDPGNRTAHEMLDLARHQRNAGGPSGS